MRHGVFSKRMHFSYCWFDQAAPVQDSSDEDSESDTARGRRSRRQLEQDMIKRKEEELLAMIAQQKAELANLQMERDLEEKRVGCFNPSSKLHILICSVLQSEAE